MGWGSGGSESNSGVGWCSETCIWRTGGGELAWRWHAAANRGNPVVLLTRVNRMTTSRTRYKGKGSFYSCASRKGKAGLRGGVNSQHDRAVAAPLCSRDGG
jgi:hypothetical protein